MMPTTVNTHARALLSLSLLLALSRLSDLTRTHSQRISIIFMGYRIEKREREFVLI